MTRGAGTRCKCWYLCVGWYNKLCVVDVNVNYYPVVLMWAGVVVATYEDLLRLIAAGVVVVVSSPGYIIEMLPL